MATTYNVAIYLEEHVMYNILEVIIFLNEKIEEMENSDLVLSEKLILDELNNCLNQITKKVLTFKLET